MPQIIHHTHRALLGITGSDAATFLQGAITQDITKITEAQPLYGAHLTPQGKFLHDFFIGKQGEMWLLETTTEQLMSLATALHHYVVGKDVMFHDLTADYHILSADTPLPSAFCFTDPRHPDMGYRAWQASTAPLPEITTDTANYTARRIDLLIPEGDAIPNRTLVNELNFERINGVCFNKGCYVGQELTARTKFRTEPKKKLVHVSFDTNQTLPFATPLLATNGQEAGYLFTHQAGRGIALMRTRYLEKQQQFQTAGGNTTVTVA